MPHIQIPKYPQALLDYSLTTPQVKKKNDTVIIFLHGFASHQKGEKVLYLRDRFNEIGTSFLAFDHRGHGQSSGTMKDLTVTHNLEDLKAIIESLCMGYKKRVLIGSSMGGQTAAWFSAQFPHMINANLLIAPGFRFLENRVRDIGPEGLKKLIKEGELTFRNQWLEITIGKELLDDAQKYSAKKLLQHYHTPTLILHGIQDETVPFGDSVHFVQNSLAQALELVLIAGGDHRLTDHKELLFQYMELFCRRLNLL